MASHDALQSRLSETKSTLDSLGKALSESYGIHNFLPHGVNAACRNALMDSFFKPPWKQLSTPALAHAHLDEKSSGLRETACDIAYNFACLHYMHMASANITESRAEIAASLQALEQQTEAYAMLKLEAFGLRKADAEAMAAYLQQLGNKVYVSPPRFRSPEAKCDYYTRAVQGMHNKIVDIYGIDAAALTLPEEKQRYLDGFISRTLSEPRWQRTCAQALRASGLTADAQPMIEAAMRDIVAQHLDTYLMAQQLKDGSSVATHVPAHMKALYETSSTREDFIKLYSNHAVNRGEALLETLGLTPASAHVVNGNAIGMACNGYRLAANDIDAAATYPRLGHVKDGSEHELCERIREQHDYSVPLHNRFTRRYEDAKHARTVSSGTYLS